MSTSAALRDISPEVINRRPRRRILWFFMYVNILYLPLSVFQILKKIYILVNEMTVQFSQQTFPHKNVLIGSSVLFPKGVNMWAPSGYESKRFGNCQSIRNWFSINLKKKITIQYVFWLPFGFVFLSCSLTWIQLNDLKSFYRVIMKYRSQC